MMESLRNWKLALDGLIGDTVEEIARRRIEHADAVRVRDDLFALIEYLDTTEIPAPARRALERCLNWNPYTKR